MARCNNGYVKNKLFSLYHETDNLLLHCNCFAVGQQYQGRQIQIFFDQKELIFSEPYVTIGHCYCYQGHYCFYYYHCVKCFLKPFTRQCSALTYNIEIAVNIAPQQLHQSLYCPHRFK